MGLTRQNKYQAYLNSPVWRMHRDFALARTSGFCQFCGQFASQVHHVRYPKQFGEEHPHSLIPICKRCHNISHGIQEMKTLGNVTRMRELSPNGGQLHYLISGGRVYASAKSWAKALQVPEAMKGWFETGLSRTALLNKNVMDGELEMTYQDVLVYRWHAVAEQLRVFDRQWYQTQFKGRPKQEQRDLEKFHDNYERLVRWGYELQERALSRALTSNRASGSPVTQETLLEAIKQAIAPRLRDHDNKLHEHDVVITELKEVVPVLRDHNEFISIKQAITEQGLDSTVMPLYPKSKENLSTLAGQLLKKRKAEQGPSVVARLDGRSLSAEMNTYKRGDIYAVLTEIKETKQFGFSM